MERAGTGRAVAVQCLGVVSAIGLCLLLQGCPTPYDLRHEDQWDSREQVWRSEDSQVKMRTAQSRAFDTVDQHVGKSLDIIISNGLQPPHGPIGGHYFLHEEVPANTTIYRVVFRVGLWNMVGESRSIARQSPRRRRWRSLPTVISMAPSSTQICW